MVSFVIGRPASGKTYKEVVRNIEMEDCPNE